MSRTKTRAAAAAIALTLLALPLAGCAPEPGSVRPDGSSLEEKHEPDGESWPEKNPDEAYEKQQELPADFPAAFVVPEGAAVDDAGSRAPGSWYLVLRADSAEAADALWDEVVSAGSFEARDAEGSGDARSATLVGGGLEVAALTLPGEDGAVLLSYDITAEA